MKRRCPVLRMSGKLEPGADLAELTVVADTQMNNRVRGGCPIPPPTDLAAVEG